MRGLVCHLLSPHTALLENFEPSDMVNSLLHEWVGRLSVTGKTKIGLLLEKNQKLVFLLDTPPGADPLSLPPLTAGGGFHVAASWASSGASWVRTSDQAGDCCAGAHGKNVKVHRRCTDARPGSKPRTTHPVHLWLIKCTEAGPGWSPVPARLGLCGTPLRTSLRHACDSFPARFQLVSSSFPARFQLVSSSVLSSVAFPVGNR